jgi:DNA modification methylase
MQKACSTKGSYYGAVSEQPWKQVTGRYYTHHLDFKRNIDGYSTRPNEMVELMYKCYTKPGDIVLDCFCHHGMSGIIAKKLELHWIGIDKYFLPCKLIE